MCTLFILSQGGIYIDDFHGIIYCATNLINNKKYIGQTIRSLKRRMKEHISNAKKHGKYAIHQAIVKYGEDNFKWETLDTANNQEELDEKEKYWIKYYNTFYDGGYNMATGGQCNLSDNPEESSSMRGGKMFYVFDLDGNFIKETMSQTEFAKEIGVSVQTVNNILIGIKNSTKHYILIFKDEFNEQVLKDKIYKIKYRYRDFAVFNKEGNLVGIRNNKMQCSKEFNMERANIQRQLNQGIGIDTFKQYQFFYLENIPEELKDKIKEVI